MREPDSFALQAMLYSGGELSGGEAAAFERLLADDQAARDALVQAVQLSLPLRVACPSGPDPAYRDRVRRRLRGGLGQWLFGRRSYRGHPLLWSGLGAMAAALLVFFLTLPRPADQPHAQASLPNGVTEDDGPLRLSWPDNDGETFDVAQVWAEMPKGDHLIRAHEDEVRRKVRAEDRPRTARLDDLKGRPMSNSNSKPGAEKPR